jgi:hypothetical protein
LAFLVLYVSCFLTLYCEQKSYDRIIEEKQQIEEVLLEAIEYTAFKCKAVIKDTTDKKTQVIAESFSEALYISMGLFDTTESEEFWRFYVPMLVLVEEEGAYFYSVRANLEESDICIYHEWSDKIVFEVPEECNETRRAAIIADTLEKKASQIISDHNLIASQYGITYQYFLPKFFQNCLLSSEFPVLLVVFQGWPLNTEGTIFYENCLDAGVFLREKTD